MLVEFGCIQYREFVNSDSSGREVSAALISLALFLCNDNMLLIYMLYILYIYGIINIEVCIGSVSMFVYSSLSSQVCGGVWGWRVHHLHGHGPS